MMNIPEEFRYTESHEWVRREDDGTLTFGITDHAQDALGDIVYVEPPEVGATLEQRRGVWRGGEHQGGLGDLCPDRRRDRGRQRGARRDARSAQHLALQ